MRQQQFREVGRVAEVQVFPVKSLAGRSVPEVGIEPAGLAGDRAWVVLGADGGLVRGKDAPALAGIPATGDPVVDEPAVRAALGDRVRLAPAPAPAPGAAAVHLVSRQALDRAAAGQVPEGCSADDPRANLLVVLAEDDGDERAWVGQRLRVGTAVLEITRLPKHCLGVYAQVREPGRVGVGDPLRLETTAAG